MIKDYFRLAYQSAKKRKLRSWLTLIGIFIGVAAVVSLLSLGQGLQNSINEEFKKMGANRITVSPGGAFFGPSGGSLLTGEITTKDLAVIRKTEGVELAGGVLVKNAKLQFKDEVDYLSVWGFPTDQEGEKLIEGISFFEMEKGRQLKKGDNYKAVLGYDIAQDNFKRPLSPGDKLKIKERDFEVVGIQKKAGTGVHDAILRIPLETARELFAEQEELSTIFVLTQLGYEPEQVAESLKKELRNFRNLKEDEEDFTVATASQTISQLNQILAIVNLAVLGIAAISILVGGIGIMNTMYTTVLERTKEIGIMKALGAQNYQISFLFLVESGLLGLLGGAIGLVLGLGMAKFSERLVAYFGITIFHISLSGYLIAGALFFSFLLGTLSGLLPARQAALLPPVEALRKSK